MSDAKAAEYHFGQGLDAMKREDFKAACDAFKRSDDAESSPGAQINLGLCNDKLGKTASAWAWYRSAAGLADRKGQPDRVTLARAEAAKLEPRLRKLVIELEEAAPPSGFVLKQDGVPVASSLFGLESPIDPGAHVFEGSAPGRRAWTTSLTIQPGPGVDRLRVPTLVREDDTATASAPREDAADRGSTQRIIGLSLGGVGLAAGVAAGILGVMTLSDESSRSDAQDRANAATDPVRRQEAQAEADDIRSSALSKQTAAIVTGAVAGAFLAGGLIVFFTAPSGGSSSATALPRGPRVTPFVGFGAAGLSGSF